jgi:Cellulose binding domain
VSPVPSPSPSPSPTPTPVPSPTPTPTPLPSPLPPGTFSCVARWEMSRWIQEGSNYAVINLYLKNTSSLVLKTPWALRLENSNYQKLAQSWNWEPQLASGVISGNVSADWQTLLPAGGNEVNVGVIVSGAQSDLTPKTVSINGIACGIIAPK